jgi:hypothetical protein
VADLQIRQAELLVYLPSADSAATHFTVARELAPAGLRSSPKPGKRGTPCKSN